MTTEVRISSNHIGWILEAFARESAFAIDLNVNFLIIPTRRREYFYLKTWLRLLRRRISISRRLFIHHTTLLKFKGDLEKCPSRVLLTHFDSDSIITPLLLKKLLKLEMVIVQNNRMKEMLIDRGLDKSKVRVVLGAVDRAQYFPKISMPLRTYVLIVGECKPRKNPELISQVIIDNPKIDFVIHGNGWEQYLLLPHRNLQNLVIIPFSLKNNPELLREATLLLSLSKLEGGPIPVLEALASGTPVLATDTGFSRDVINETNGRVLPVDADVNLISEHLNSLLNLKSKLWNRDLLDGNYTWANLGKAIYE